MNKGLLIPAIIGCVLVLLTGCSRNEKGSLPTTDTDSIEEFDCPCCAVVETIAVVDEPAMEVATEKDVK